MIRELFLEDLSLWSCLWQSTLLAAMGLGGSILLRHRPARAFQVLLLAMLAAAIVPVLSALVKHFELGAFVAKPVSQLSETRGMPLPRPHDAPAVLVEPQAGGEVQRVALDLLPDEGRSGSFGISGRAILLFSWLTATLALLGRLLIAFINGVHLIRRSRPEVRQHIRQALEQAEARLGIANSPQLRASGEIHSPMVWRWSGTAILLVPHELDNNIDWVGVICHELAHCIRRDHISGLAAELITCILWWNPLSWLAKKRLVRLGEQACDDWVVAGGQPVEHYARSLLNFKPQKQAAFVPAVVHSRKGVAARVRRILKDRPVNPQAGTKWALAVCVVTVCLATGIAFAQTRPAKPETVKTEKQNAPTGSLHDAAQSGDFAQVKKLITQGADINAKDRVGITALHHAIYTGHTDIVGLLINEGANVNAIARNLGTPLHIAATRGDKKTIELLLSKGADINAKNRKGRTALFETMTGQVPNQKEVVELLLARGAKIPALHLAAYRGDMEKSEKCLQDGIDINSQEDFGGAALHLAASSGQKSVVEFLISKGASVDTKDAWDWTPLHYAAHNNCQNAIVLLLAKGANLNAVNRDNRTPLDEAAMMGHKDAAELFIAKGANVNAKLRDGYTPVFWAAFGGHRDMVEFLIAKGADVNAKNVHGWTPLHIAAHDGHKDVVELLIAKGADINTRTTAGDSALSMALAQPYEAQHKKAAYEQIVALLRKHGAKEESPSEPNQPKPGKSLHEAAADGDIDQVRLLISEGADVDARGRWPGDTPLNRAAAKGHKNVVELLISKGADVNLTNRIRMSPLHSAIGSGHAEVAELLIAQGADVNARGVGKITPMDLAVNEGLPEVVKLLIEKGAKVRFPAMHLAAFQGDVGSVKSFIEKGTSVDAKDDKGETPLFLATLGGQKEMVDFLLSKGADVNATDTDGETPLHKAALYGRKDVAELLIAKGAAVNMKDKSEETPLHEAVVLGRRNIIELLVAKGANVNMPDNSGRTPLYEAINNDDRETMELLIAKGADVNTQDEHGDTPLYEATLQGNRDLIALLTAKGATTVWTIHLAAGAGDLPRVKGYIEQGSSIDEKDKSGQTPLMLAVWYSRRDVVELLLARGANVNVTRDDGWTALHLACLPGRENVAELLIAKGADVNARNNEGGTPLRYAQIWQDPDAVELLRKHGAKE